MRRSRPCPSWRPRATSQAAILDATIEVVDRDRSRRPAGSARSSRADWERVDRVPRDQLGLVPNPVTIDDVLDTGLLPARRLTAVLGWASGRARRAGRGGCVRRWPRNRRAAPDLAAAAPPLRGSTTADVVVVGGGYTGLWTALRLTELEPGARVVLLEADICGGGPSGRNGGFVTNWWDELPTLIERLRRGRARSASARPWMPPSTRSAVVRRQRR